MIQVSSNRGSLSNSLIPGRLPTSVVWAYDGSKAALNKMSIELAKTELERELGQGEKRVEVQVVCPGHCRTGFNGFRGAREPEEGVDVAVQLVAEEGGGGERGGRGERWGFGVRRGAWGVRLWRGGGELGRRRVVDEV